MLGLATFEGPHLVVLDEPTNHLDIDSRAALIEAINDYSGAVIVVSHDRFLLEACADRLWLVAGGEVHPFDGDLDDYRRFILTGGAPDPARSAPAEAPRVSRAAERRAAAEKRNELAPLRRRIDDCDKTITRLTKTIADIDAALGDPTLYRRDPGRAAKLGKERADAAGALAEAEDRWLMLSTQYDEAMAAP
jgi:ATP-binding cassette subfamily F protein 3